MYYGPSGVSSDWTDFTPPSGATTWQTNTTYTARFKQVGKLLHIQLFVELSGAPDNAFLTVGLPSGFTVDDPAGVSSSLYGDVISLGTAIFLEGGIGRLWGDVALNRTDPDRVQFRSRTFNVNDDITPDANVDATTPHTWGAGDAIRTQFVISVQ